MKEIVWDGPPFGHYDRGSRKSNKLSFNNESKGIHRIPYGRTVLSRQKGPKRPVFLQHGLLNSDADWLINPTDRALGNHILFSFCTSLKNKKNKSCNFLLRN